MVRNTSQVKLDDLKADLHNLKSQPLREEARVTLQAADQHLIELARELRLSQEHVQKADQAKSKFISIVTHELRVPITYIKGYTDLLRQGLVGAVNEQQLNFLNVIRNNTERMEALISDLSDIPRIETGRLKLDCEHIQLQDCVEEAHRSLQPKI